MPSTTSKRASRWPGGDFEAMKFLREAGYRWPGGVIKRVKGRPPTEREWDAILYLIEEWDFGWEPTPGAFPADDGGRDG